MEWDIKNGKMGKNKLENLLMVKKKEKGKRHGQMVRNMKVPLNQDLNTAMENANFLKE